MHFAEIRQLFKNRVCSFVCHLYAGGVHRRSLEAGATVAGFSRRAIGAFPAHKCLVFYQIYKIQRDLIDNLSDPAGRGAFLSTTESTFVLVVFALVPNARDLAYRR